MSDSVDEIKAYVVNLVSALGGPDPADPRRRYKLGDEALLCLRDIKKWLQYFDNKLNRWDVAGAISQTSLMTSDILEILAQWDHDKQNKRTSVHHDKIALACLEVMVPLTWPLELNNLTTTRAQYDMYPRLRQAQLRYKQAVLHHPSHSVLRAVLRLVVDSMRKPPSERTKRDSGIIRLAVLYFRNLLKIDSSDNTNFAAASDIDRSATINEFNKQKVLDFLITIAAGSSREFALQAIPVLETLFGLLYSIDPEDLFTSTSSSATLAPAGRKLADLLDQEKRMRAAVHLPSRHNRFGTLVSLRVDETTHLTVSGQKAASSTLASLQEIDQSKTWRRPMRNVLKEHERWNVQVTLDLNARRAIKDFSNRFLDASFNPIMDKIRGLIEREDERLDKANNMHYLYLLGWFLQVERLRHPKSIDFQLIGSALNHNTSIVIMKLIISGHELGEMKNDDLVHAGMIAYRNLLLVVEKMAHANDDWVEIADSIKARLFYDEIWLDTLCKLPRSSVQKTLAYACETIELIHVVLKVLEEYSTQHTYLYVKSKRARKRANAQAADMEGSDDENEDEQRESARVTKERKFDFARFESRFLTESTLETYERVLANFIDVSGSTLKHVLAFMHRAFIKRESRAIFYKLSLMKLLLKCTSPIDGVRPEPLRKAFDQFMCHYTRALIKSLKKTPALYMEVLFSKASTSLFYLDHGYDKALAIGRPAKAVDLEFNDESVDREQKYAIMVAALIDQDKADMLEWVESTLSPFVDLQREFQRKRLFTAEKPRLVELARDPLARLLMRTTGLMEEGGRWFVPETVGALELIEVLEYIGKYKSQAVVFENNKMAMDQVHIRRHGEEDNEAEDGGYQEPSDSEGDEEDRFNDVLLQPLPADELLARKMQLAGDKRRKRKTKNPSNEPKKRSKSQKEGVFQERQKRELAAQIKFKSEAFVHDSDDFSDVDRDREFFERELLQRNTQLPSGEEVIERGALDEDPERYSWEQQAELGAVSPQSLEDQPLESSSSVSLASDISADEGGISGSAATPELAEDDPEDLSESPSQSPELGSQLSLVSGQKRRKIVIDDDSD